MIRERDIDANIGWVKIDAASLIIDLNEGAARIIGSTREALLGTSVMLIIPPEYREQHFVAVNRRAAGGESRIAGLPLRLPMLRADGTRTEVEIVLQPPSEDETSPPETFTATFFEIEPKKESWWVRFWNWGVE